MFYLFYNKCSSTNVLYDLFYSVSSETKRLEAFSFFVQTTWIVHLSNSCTRSERYFPSRSLTGILFNLQIYQLRSEKLGQQETRYDSTDRKPETSALQISSDEPLLSVPPDRAENEQNFTPRAERNPRRLDIFYLSTAIRYFPVLLLSSPRKLFTSAILLKFVASSVVTAIKLRHGDAFYFDNGMLARRHCLLLITFALDSYTSKAVRWKNGRHKIQTKILSSFLSFYLLI